MKEEEIAGGKKGFKPPVKGSKPVRSGNPHVGVKEQEAADEAFKDYKR